MNEQTSLMRISVCDRCGSTTQRLGPLEAQVEYESATTLVIRQGVIEVDGTIYELTSDRSREQEAA